MTKKKLLSVSLVVIMLAILSFSTLAWFNAKDKVTNEFTILNSLKNFDVDVWEMVPGDDGKLTDVGKGVEEGENATPKTYEDVVPGVDYTKEVHIQNNSGNKLAGQYIKMEVTFTNYAALNAMKAAGETGLFDCTTMLQGANFSSDKNDADATKIWWYDAANTKYDSTKNEATYVFYLKEVLENGVDKILFTGVRMPESMDINDAAYLIDKGGFQIKAIGYAIQSANIDDGDGDIDLDDVLYAFGEPWEKKDEAGVADPTFPAIPN